MTPIVRIRFVHSVRLDTEQTYATSDKYVITELANGDVNLAPLRGTWTDSIDGKAVPYTVDVKAGGIAWMERAIVAEPVAKGKGKP